MAESRSRPRAMRMRARYCWQLIRLTQGRYLYVLGAIALAEILRVSLPVQRDAEVPTVSPVWLPTLTALAAAPALNVYKVCARGLGTVRFDAWRLTTARAAIASRARIPSWLPVAGALVAIAVIWDLFAGHSNGVQLAAFPVILFNSASGSDSAASGAGPATAVTGSKGRTRNTASQTRVGFFEASAPDLSGVVTTGAHALFISISTAGQRNWSSINAVKNTEHTTTGNMTSASAVLSSLASTTGWAAGDVVKVTGAGAAGADLYSTIVTVDSSTQVTLNDAAGTSVTGNAVHNPKQVGLTSGEGLNTGTTDTSWAIGGTRASLTSASSLKLFNNNSADGDAQGGWILELQSGYTESFSLIRWYRPGSATNGPITLRGEVGAATLPILTCTANSFMFDSDTGRLFQAFEVRNSNGTKTASSFVANWNEGNTAGMNMVMDRITANHATNKFHKFVRGGNNQEIKGSLVLLACSIGNQSNDGIEGNCNATAGYGYTIIGCDIFSNGANGLNINKMFRSSALVLGNRIRSNTTNGIGFNAGVGDREAVQFLLWNAIHSNTTNGISLNTNASLTGMTIWGNHIYSNGSYGISSTPTLAELQNAAWVIGKNKIWGNTSGDTNPSGINDLGNPGGMFTLLPAQSFLLPPSMGGGIHG